MNTQTRLNLAWIVAVVALSVTSAVRAAPGEDPVVITHRVTYLQVPTAAPAASTELVQRSGLPDYAQAKISRYVAKAYSPETGNIKTEKDVVTATHTQGMQTTCIQSLTPTSATGAGSSLMNNEQVVVLRGDLVNFCN